MSIDTPNVSDQVLQGKESKSLLDEEVCMECVDFSLFYSEKQALFKVSMKIPSKRVTAFIGPSGCGNSPLLGSLNGLTDLVEGGGLKVK